MGAHIEHHVVYSKILRSGNLHSCQLKLLFGGCSGVIQVSVDLLDVKNDEFSQPITTKNGFERRLPIGGRIDLKRL